MRKWRDLSPAERAAREQLTRKWGRAGLLIGLILIVATIGWGAYVVQGGGEIACPPAQEKIAGTATVVVLGTILAGVATPTEAAIIGVLAVIVTGSLIYRELKVVDVGRHMISTAS